MSSRPSRRPRLQWDCHLNNLQTMFNYQLCQGRFTDVTLACQGGRTLKAHRSVLSACSSYFDLVLGNTSLDKETIVIIKDCNFDEVQLLIDFMYNGQICVDEVNFGNMLAVFFNDRVPTEVIFYFFFI